MTENEFMEKLGSQAFMSDFANYALFEDGLRGIEVEKFARNLPEKQRFVTEYKTIYLYRSTEEEANDCLIEELKKYGRIAVRKIGLAFPEKDKFIAYARIAQPKVI